MLGLHRLRCTRPYSARQHKECNSALLNLCSWKESELHGRTAKAFVGMRKFKVNFIGAAGRYNNLIAAMCYLVVCRVPHKTVWYRITSHDICLFLFAQQPHLSQYIHTAQDFESGTDSIRSIQNTQLD